MSVDEDDLQNICDQVCFHQSSSAYPVEQPKSTPFPSIEIFSKCFNETTGRLSGNSSPNSNVFINEPFWDSTVNHSLIFERSFQQPPQNAASFPFSPAIPDPVPEADSEDFNPTYHQLQTHPYIEGTELEELGLVDIPMNDTWNGVNQIRLPNADKKALSLDEFRVLEQNNYITNDASVRPSMMHSVPQQILTTSSNSEIAPELQYVQQHGLLEEKKRTNRKPRQKSRPGASDERMIELCKVCGAESSGFHYGVQTCEGCKSFFRRCLTSPPDRQCLYKDKNPPPITVGNRKHCQHCRFAKCLQVGMQRKRGNKRKLSDYQEDSDQQPWISNFAQGNKRQHIEYQEDSEQQSCISDFEQGNDDYEIISAGSIDNEIVDKNFWINQGANEAVDYTVQNGIVNDHGPIENF